MVIIVIGSSGVRLIAPVRAKAILRAVFSRLLRLEVSVQSLSSLTWITCTH